MKKNRIFYGILALFGALTMCIITTKVNDNIFKSTSSVENYKIVLNKDNYATVEEIGTFSNPKNDDNLLIRKTALGNDITFQLCSGKGTTNNTGSSTPDKFCQMPASNYGWIVNKNALTGISKIKVTVQQTAAVFRLDLSKTQSLEGYYYSATQPSYVDYRSQQYTGSSSYEITISGSYNYFRFQNLSESGHLSLTSLEIYYSCSSSEPTQEYRGIWTNDPETTFNIGPYDLTSGTVIVDYIFADPVTDSGNGVSMFLGSDTSNRFGNYKLLKDSLENSYDGVTFETLSDGYNRITFDIPSLNAVFNGETAPTTITKIMFKWFEARKGLYFDVNPQDRYEKTTELQMSGSNFVIANFTDIHVTEESFLSDSGTVGKTIKYAIQNSNPDLLLFSGDIAGSSSDLSYVFDYIDSFKIPYFVILGNHDHEGSLGYNTIASYIGQSKYGYIEKGPDDLGSQGNYTVQIKNTNGQLVHGLVMMDTGNKYTITDDSLVEYVDNPIKGVSYGSYGGRTTYCASGWNGLRGNQIDWYKDAVDELGCQTTLVCHIPFLEYVKAYEIYKDALNNNNTAAVNACAPIGPCHMGEPSCGSIENLGIFDAILAKNSTKNVLCGHDHVNDFSLLYQGVRLTYCVKTGEGSYWKNDGSICGYTELTIDSTGQTTLDQIFYNPLTSI